MNGLTIKTTNILTTDFRVFSAWELHTGDMLGGSHSEQMTFDGLRMGRVGTRRLPKHLQRLPPGSLQRVAAVQAWHAEEYRRAYSAILAEHPDVAPGRRSMGEITLHLPAA